MKKILSIAMIFLVVLSTFSMLAPKGVTEETKSFQVLWRVPILDNVQCNAGAGDLDGDGIDDVVAIPNDGHYGQHGTVNTMQAIKSDGTDLWSSTFLIEWGKVELVDIDGDGRSEVIAGGTSEDWWNTDGLVYAFDDNGVKLWEYWETIDSAFWGVDSSRFIFTDVDGDDLPEIVVVDGGYLSHYAYCLDGDGSTLWRFLCDQHSDVAFEDVTGDGVEEIIIASHGTYAPSSNIYVLNKNGGLIWNYPTNYHELPWYNQVVGIGDLTGDGINDIGVTCRGCDGYGYANILYTLRNDGTFLWSKQFSRTFVDQPSNPVLEDIDGDGISDIILYAEGKINAYKSDGSLLWAGGDYSEPIDFMLFDIDRDGEEEIIYQLGQEVYEVSLDGSITFVGSLDNEGRLLRRPSQGHHSVSGDVNNDGFDELIIQEKIDGQYYVAVVVPPSISILSAAVDIDPNSLNLWSKGKWITCYIEIPEGYDVSDINVSTILLNETIPAELHPIGIGDEDGDDIPDLVVKFDRAEVTSYILANVNMTKLIEERFMTITLTVTGELDDGTPFQGSDTIKIMLPTHGKRGIFPI